jgi:hypothetical protein
MAEFMGQKWIQIPAADSIHNNPILLMLTGRVLWPAEERSLEMLETAKCPACVSSREWKAGIEPRDHRIL